jgi:molybdenum cofactor cytidylyltransferase
MSIVGILLAAGRSTRFGGDKLLAPLADGRPLALPAAMALAGAVDRAVAVLARGDGPLGRLLAGAGLAPVVCPASARGMGHSLACGVAASPEAEGWVVALADMPHIRPATMADVAHALRRGAPLAAPVHRGRRGHPVGFSRAYRERLLALAGDQGARSLLRGEASRVVLLPCDDPGVLLDIDRPEDLGGHAP